MLHPDIKHQVYLSFLEERRQQAPERQRQQTGSQSQRQLSLSARLLLASGDWLILLGTHLKGHARPQLRPKRKTV